MGELLQTTLIAAVMSAAASAAVAAPAGLLGKSVVVSWSEARVQRFVGEANWRSVNASHELSVYVSSAGRVFSKFSATTRRGTGANEQVSGEGGNRVPSFSGNSMTIVAAQQGMARRVAVEFDGGFSSCTASVIRGKESGAGSGFAKSVIIGQRIEIQSVSTGSASCSVRAGNVFGN
jgi:hypothetical protein